MVVSVMPQWLMNIDKNTSDASVHQHEVSPVLVPAPGRWAKVKNINYR